MWRKPKAEAQEKGVNLSSEITGTIKTPVFI